MNTSEHEGKHRELTRKILGVFFEVYNELVTGFWSLCTRSLWG